MSARAQGKNREVVCLMQEQRRGVLHIIGEKLFLREREEVMFLRVQKQRRSFFSAIAVYSFSFSAHAELFLRG
jgi:hypothetical protein